MCPIWKRKPFLGFGIGVGVLGALALALRHRQRRDQGRIPDQISPAIFSTRVAATSQGEIVYHICGSGTPIVFLHGFFLGASSYEWSKVYAQFALRHEVIAPDLVGFGESERPAEALDALDHVESLVGLLHEVVGTRPVTLVASGAGANVALLLAARHPELTARLELFLPSSLQDEAKIRTMGLIGKSRIPGITRLVYRRHLAQPSFIRGWLSRSGFADPQKITDETVDVLSTCAQQYGAEHAIFSFLKNRRSFDVSTRLADIVCPVHILWPGRASGFYPAEVTALCRSLPRASMEVLPEASAFAAMESPAEIAASLSRWIDGDLVNLQSD